jgi:FkbM family methyltransferase
MNGRHIAKYGTHEPLLTRWLADYLAVAPSGIVVDIGANIGWHTLHAAQHRNVEAVVAFEPDPFNAWLLDRNLADNEVENVVVDARAVGAKAGIGRLHRYKHSNFGRHTLAGDLGYGSRAVAITDLDGALVAHGLSQLPISLIKINVEGFEPAVISGAGRSLARAAAVVTEYSPTLSDGGGLTGNDMLVLLQAIGFTPFVLRSEGGTSRTSVEEVRGLNRALDIIWVRMDTATPEIKSAMRERERGRLKLAQIAEQSASVVRYPDGRPPPESAAARMVKALAASLPFRR